MSDDNRTIPSPDSTHDEEQSAPHTSAIIRSLPAVTFGLRAAALAGMVISTAAVTTGLAGIFGGGTTNDPNLTTCCSR